MVPKLPRAQLVKWCAVLSTVTELTPDQAFYETGLRVVDWQRRIVLHVVKAGQQHVIQAELERQADEISWAVYEYVTRLDLKMADDDGEDYMPMSREQYVKAMNVFATMPGDKAAYLLDVNSHPNDRHALAEWFFAGTPQAQNA